MSDPENPRLRIAVDYFPAATHGPGVGRFARELTRALAALPDGPALRLIDWGGGPRPIGEPALGLAGARDLRRFRVPLPRRLARLPGAWGLFARRLGRLDAMLALSDDWPPPLAAPRWRPYSSLPEWAGPSLGRTESVPEPAPFGSGHRFCFSSEGEALLAAQPGYSAERVARLPVGCEHWWRDLAPEARAAPPLERERRVLVLGALDGRRGHLPALEAFEQLHARGRTEELLVIGRRAAGADAFESRLRFSSARSVVRRIDPPAESELARLVAESAVLVHLGELDATPVTPLEVARLGRAVVCLDRPTYTEALGNAGHYVPWAREYRQAEALVPVLDAALDSAFDVEATARRRARAEPFTWEACARAAVAAWRGGRASG